MKYNLTVNSIKSLDPKSMDAGFYIVLEAMGFRRLDRWPTGAFSAWAAGEEKDVKIDWTNLFSIAEAFGVTLQVTSEQR